MELSNALKSTKIIETIENYSLVENDKVLSTDQKNLHKRWHCEYDEEFWNRIISNPEHYWNTKIDLYNFTLCNWVARVPGLYWAEYSKSVRQHSENEVAEQSENWIEFHPPGKSRKVLGGIGTVKLPPNGEGKRLLSLSSSSNASLGIPALIFPDVFDSLNLKEGDVLRIKNARWQPLDIEWSKRFATTNGIPRGCLIIDSTDKVDVSKKDNPVAYQPFSIMEYQKGDALLFDFVYLSVDSKLDNGRKKLEDFFHNYAKKENRNGRYLLNTNLVQPLFEAQYISPLDMQHSSEKAKINLIYKRIRDVGFNRTTLDKLIEALPQYFDSSSAIKRLAKSIGVSTAILQDDNVASMSAQLINHCSDINKIEELTDRMVVEYSQIFNS